MGEGEVGAVQQTVAGQGRLQQWEENLGDNEMSDMPVKVDVSLLLNLTWMPPRQLMISLASVVV